MASRRIRFRFYSESQRKKGDGSESKIKVILLGVKCKGGKKGEIQRVKSEGVSLRVTSHRLKEVVAVAQREKNN